MLRRLLPTLVGLLIGLVALGEGLFALARIFTAERNEARSLRVTESRAIEEAATRALTSALERRHREATAAILDAVSDPLAPSEGLYFRFRGHQFLPRLARASARSETPARDAYARPSLDPQHPLRLPEELALHLRHAEQALDPALLTQALPEALGGSTASAGLERDVLRARPQLSRGDFEFLCAHVVALGTRLGLPMEAFAARAAEVPAGAVVLPDPLPEAMLLGERWYLEPSGEERTSGLAVSLEEVLAELVTGMRARGSLPRGARFELEPHPALARLSELALRVHVEAWDQQREAIDSRFALKTSLLVVCGLLALGLAVFTLLAQERKRRFVELKGDFVATVSHELKTPLASIRLLAETLDAGGPVETTREYPARIVKAADTLHFLVQNILTFNALGKSPAAVREGPVRLEELMVPLRRELDEAFGARVVLTSELGDTEVEGDPALLQLVFANLARNACLYNQRTPIELRVRARTDTRGAVTVLFEDNGVGIADRDRRRVFEDFVRAAPPGVEAHGSGLGLALCRRILRQHGGKIRIAETGPAGTTFSLHFPALR